MPAAWPPLAKLASEEVPQVPSWLHTIGAFLTAHEKQLTAVAAIATTAMIFVAVLQLRDARKTLEASTIYSLQKDGRELLKTYLLDDPPVFDYVLGSTKIDNPDPKVVAKADFAITAMIQYMSAVLNQHRNGSLSDPYWESVDGELCAIVRRPVVTAFWIAKVRKGKYSEYFKAWGDGCLDRPATP